MAKRRRIIVRRLVIVLTVLVLLTMAFIYLWPLGETSLSTSHPQTLTYAESVANIAAVQANEANIDVRPECRTQFLTHGSATAKMIVMFHGVGACPVQFAAMGTYFYNRGYNVYIPRAPHYGLTSNRDHGKVTAQELVSYTDSSVTIGTGLGTEHDVIGISGGGVLATWAAEYRPDAVDRLEVLSPFYAPSKSAVPFFERRFLSVLYGLGILPDSFNSAKSTALSFHALGQYMRLTANFKSDPVNTNLKSITSVTAPGDMAIDHEPARTIPQHIATTNNLTLNLPLLPVSWGLGHDIATAEPNRDINGHSTDLYPIYFTGLEN